MTFSHLHNHRNKCQRCPLGPGGAWIPLGGVRHLQRALMGGRCLWWSRRGLGLSLWGQTTPMRAIPPAWPWGTGQTGKAGTWNGSQGMAGACRGRGTWSGQEGQRHRCPPRGMREGPITERAGGTARENSNAAAQGLKERVMGRKELFLFCWPCPRQLSLGWQPPPRLCSLLRRCGESFGLS